MVLRRVVVVVAIVCGVALSIATIGCTRIDSYYVAGNFQERHRLRELFRYLRQPDLSPQMRLTLYELIGSQLEAAGYPERMRNFIAARIEAAPSDIYNVHYLNLIAKSYLQSGDRDTARYYLHRVVWNYDDIKIDGHSIQREALITLAEIENDDRRRADFLTELIERFPDNANDPLRYLQLAESYERIAEWDKVYESYQQLVELCETRDGEYCSDLPNSTSIATVRANLRFWQSQRNWTAEKLDDLVTTIKRALSRRDASTLLLYRPSVNFFARSWHQEEFDFNSQINFNIGIFLRRSRVSSSDAIDINSNAQEAYLRTWGWSHRIPTWYFYFRRVDFPADPRTHGNWEWAGIFFGEQL